nr:ROK family transcriptional regulator [Galbitalea soli]
MLAAGALSRPELASRLGLSLASITRYATPLLRSGLAVERPDPEASAIGRPVNLIDLAVDDHRFAGCKITGGSAYAVLTDLRGTVIRSESTALPGHGVADVRARVAALIRSLGPAPLTAVGVTVGGRVDDGRVIVDAPFLGWHGVDFAAQLAAELETPVVVDNDVVALTSAARLFGAAGHPDDFAVITVGAGVGYGLVVGGRQVGAGRPGMDGGAHVTLDPAGPACERGHPGCASVWVSVPGMSTRAGELLGRPLAEGEFERLVVAGDVACTAVLADAARALARWLSLVADIAMVDAFLLSGEGAELFAPRIGEITREVRARAGGERAEAVITIDGSGFEGWARAAAVAAIRAALRGA